MKKSLKRPLKRPSDYGRVVRLSVNLTERLKKLNPNINIGSFLSDIVEKYIDTEIEAFNKNFQRSDTEEGS